MRTQCMPEMAMSMCLGCTSCMARHEWLFLNHCFVDRWLAMHCQTSIGSCWLLCNCFLQHIKCSTLQIYVLPTYVKMQHT